MSNLIKIKRAGVGGSATPSALAEGELAYSENSKNLFIGTNGGADIQKIGGNTDVVKLATIETNADVTDAQNVAAAGAVMESDTTTALMQFVIDEDNMASNLATKVPTQQSVKAYVDATVSSGVLYKGGYNAATNTPALDATPIATKIGDMYTVTDAGTFFTTAVEIGDVLICEAANATTEADWTIVQKNLDAASIKSAYESNADTNAFTDALETKLNGIEAAADVTDATNVAAAGAVMDGDFTQNGFLKRTGAGAYTVDTGSYQPLATVLTNTTASFTTADETKLDGLVSNVTTDLSVGTVTATNVPINSSDGADIATLPAATALLAGIVINGAQAFGGTKTFAGLTGATGAAIIDSFVIDGGSF